MTRDEKPAHATRPESRSVMLRTANGTPEGCRTMMMHGADDTTLSLEACCHTREGVVSRGLLSFGVGRISPFSQLKTSGDQKCQRVV